jgi:Ca2+-binding RTX toxin-like protein
MVFSSASIGQEFDALSQNGGTTRYDFAIDSDDDSTFVVSALSGGQYDLVIAAPGIDVVVLKGGNDAIVFGNEIYLGNQGNDTIIAGDSDANNTLFGGMNEDLLAGKDGDDRIFGDLGDDTIIGGSGADMMTGGNMLGDPNNGNDLFVLNRGAQSDTITDFETGSDRIQLPEGVAVEDVSLEGDRIQVRETGQVLARVEGELTRDDLIETTEENTLQPITFEDEELPPVPGIGFMEFTLM